MINQIFPTYSYNNKNVIPLKNSIAFLGKVPIKIESFKNDVLDLVHHPEKNDYPKIQKKLQKLLKPARFLHSISTQQIAIKICEALEISYKDASLVALIHDNAKRFKPKKLLKLAKKYNLKLEKIELLKPKKIHDPLGSYFARTEFGIKDEVLLTTLRNHGLKEKHHTILDKVLKLADKIEPFSNKKKEVKKVFEILNDTKDIDKALKFLEK